MDLLLWKGLLMPFRGVLSSTFSYNKKANLKPCVRAQSAGPPSQKASPQGTRMCVCSCFQLSQVWGEQSVLSQVAALLGQSERTRGQQG